MNPGSLGPISVKKGVVDIKENCLQLGYHDSETFHSCGIRVAHHEWDVPLQSDGS